MRIGSSMAWLVRRIAVVAVALGLVVSTAGATPVESACCQDTEPMAAHSCCQGNDSQQQPEQQRDGKHSHGCAAVCCHVIDAPIWGDVKIAKEMPGAGVLEVVVVSNGVSGRDVILPPPRA